MALYAVGDLQGCFAPLSRLLDMVAFNPSKDHLYLVGDVVARGPDSLACLEFLYLHRDAITITLGNHDLHLLACTTLNRSPNPKDKLQAVFDSPKLPQYLDLLRAQPIAVHLPNYNSFISHAGIHPTWSIQDALEYAHFVEQCYRGKDANEYYLNMYAKHPVGELSMLSKQARFTAIVNTFTRMRYLSTQGELDLLNKGGTNDCPTLVPWFDCKRFKKSKTSFIFGHWAALKGVTNMKNMIALDTGCVWGGPMSMLNIATNEQYLSK
ncbi:symmetrical bis(5'-nucleosyl)-tetraphosphatase [Pseudoalteromonas sp. MMG005]|uniref:symmetrical bis(5'-nucleosyl)-tetraphosphatase n=1 Tax=Pseudoalteromonas sp. MMG005 TaxID=2822682 RepID=UPI001B39D8E6|nr:symmetrical bis(5'-nucleosyl)-tetraphosphatase [Pseudoalteromonas sp. MMG005]MBQ4844454.1 symmetrical bis(5'-nucleosyl)-tetraphosphatase [Pseudoalteromonas sp. MMG005]